MTISKYSGIKQRLSGSTKCIASAVLASGMVLSSSAASALELRFGHEGTTDTAYHLGAIKFKELLEEKSADLSVAIFPNGTLGGEDAMFEQQMAGVLDLSIVNPGRISEFSNTANIFSIPFMYRDEEHWTNVLVGDVGDNISQRIEDETGVKVLDYFGGGVRQIVSTRPVESIEGLEGLKLRTDASKPNTVAWSALGANPTVMSYGEVYTGLQLGAIEGLLNEAEWIQRMRFYEVAPHITLSQHDITVRLFTMSQASWERLDDSQKNAVVTAAEEAAIYARDLQLAQDKKSLEELQEEGVTFYDIDRDRMKEITHNPLQGVLKELNLTDLHEQIINVQ